MTRDIRLETAPVKRQSGAQGGSVKEDWQGNAATSPDGTVIHGVLSVLSANLLSQALLVHDCMAGPALVSLANDALEPGLTHVTRGPRHVEQCQVVVGAAVLRRKDVIHAGQQCSQPQIQLDTSLCHQDDWRGVDTECTKHSDCVLSTPPTQIFYSIIFKLESRLESVSLLHDGGLVAEDHNSVQEEHLKGNILFPIVIVLYIT